MKKNNHIEILVRGVCVKDGKLLVCQSKGAANTYLPGGHLEWNEQAATGLKREIEEELGVDARVKEFLGAVEHSFIQKGERHCEINLLFSMALPSLSTRKTPESCEHWIKFKWIPLTALASNHLEPWPLRKLIGGWIKSRARVLRWGSTLGGSCANNGDRNG